MSQGESVPSLEELVNKGLDLYEVLGIPVTTTQSDIRKAYRKLALKHHPDKVHPSADSKTKDEAHSNFQKIAFAYAILSDEKRRNRYDTTGSTAEFDDADALANWVEFFSTAYKDAVSEATIEKFKAEYKGSDEERRDILTAYEKYKGNMDKIFSTVMLSEVAAVEGEGDEARFAKIIWEAIKQGEVVEYKAFSQESRQKKERRKRQALREAKEASKETKKKKTEKWTDDPEKEKKGKRKGAGGSEMNLLSMIQQRQESRRAGQEAFIEALENKYGGGKKSIMDEPPEEAFEAMEARQKRRKMNQESGKLESSKQKSTRRSKK
ncbi:hypothetical protein KEM54_001325 [Ascosphaera aggregata]|nr:hypothetical protein KEM54_001325 [Ascosphaera aggregata]